MQIFAPLKRRRRIIVAFLLLAVVTTMFFPRPAYAQFGTLAEFVNNGLGLVADAINIAAWVANIFEALVDTLVAVFLGEAWNFTAEEYFEAVKYGRLDPAKRGLLGIVGSGNIAMLTTNYPNMHTASYFRKTLATNILFQPVYAQTGADLLNPIVHIWEMVRDLAYALAAIILAIMGVMIMFRKKISATAVMTVQQAIPHIVVALILITFSFPIAGLLVDVGRVAKQLIDVHVGTTLATTLEVQMGVDDPMSPIQPFAALGVLEFGSFIDPTVNMVFNFLTLLPGLGSLSQAFRAMLTLILTIIIFVISVYLFWTLVITFTKIILGTIFAPLAFLWGALPGQEDHTSRWFRGFMVNVLSFPVIYFLFNLAVYFAGAGKFGQDIDMPTDLGWGGAIAHQTISVSGFIAMALFITASKVPKILEDAFEVTAPGSVAGAGVDVSKVAKRIPIVGNIL